MKLLVRRNQKQVTGWFGGNKGAAFSIYMKAEPTPAELSLIDKCKMQDAVLHTWEVPKPGSADDTMYFALRVSDLLRGREIELRNVGELIHNESQIIKGAKNLKQYLEVASTFGGVRYLSLRFSFREPHSNDYPVHLARVNIVININGQVIVESIAEQVEHSLAGGAVLVVPELKTERLPRLRIKSDDDFRFDTIPGRAKEIATIVGPKHGQFSARI